MTSMIFGLYLWMADEVFEHQNLDSSPSYQLCRSNWKLVTVTVNFLSIQNKGINNGTWKLSEISVFLFITYSVVWGLTKASGDKSNPLKTKALLWLLQLLLRPLHWQYFAQQCVCVWGRYENTLFKQCISVWPAYFSRCYSIVPEHVYFTRLFFFLIYEDYDVKKCFKSKTQLGNTGA